MIENVFYSDVDGGPGDWSGWSECRATCGASMQERERSCIAPEPKGKGKPCDEKDLTEIKPCKLKECPSKDYCSYVRKKHKKKVVELDKNNVLL